MSINSSDFSRVDDSGSSDGLVRYLAEVEGMPAAEAVRRQTYKLLKGAYGRGVDVGCGPGRAVSELSSLGYTVCGIDVSHRMVEAARLRYPNEDFSVGEAYSMDFDNESLGWYRAERMYLHLDRPDHALLEAFRVLAPGGRVVLADPCLDGIVVDAENIELTRNVLRALVTSVPNPSAGIRSRGLMKAAGFVDVSVNALPVISVDMSFEDVFFLPALGAAVEQGLLDDAAAEEWLAGLKRKSEDDRFTMSFTVFVTSGLRP
ncbi:methyltransferase domain-containing protein [Streptomyces sp. NPDC058664]|uniref:methyltransferase domain-containing protein n=1 Tax=unclassified Streptomyces TaxID=2593676 RepID=UPI003669EF73